MARCATVSLLGDFTGVAGLWGSCVLTCHTACFAPCVALAARPPVSCSPCGALTFPSDIAQYSYPLPAAPLTMLARLAAPKPLAAAITQLPAWLPAQRDGRTLEDGSVLGPLFGIAAIPDTGGWLAS